MKFMGHYVVKEIRDIGIGAFCAAAVATGAVDGPVKYCAIIAAAGAFLCAVNRIPETVTELNGGIAVARNFVPLRRASA